MDPFLFVAEWWWIAPSAVGAGAVAAVGTIGMRRRTRRSGRRLAVDAARHDLTTAQRTVTDRRTALKLARADHARIAAERSAQRASADQLAGARRILRERERDLKAAHADARASRVRLSAAKAAVPAASAPRPLEILRAEHDAIVARWMRYETDPALQITYPAMTDVKQPSTAAYLRAAGRANELRRAVEHRATPADFSAYREAVSDLERAFEAAEHRAHVLAGESPTAAAWQDAAQDVLTRSADAIDRAAGAAASVIAAWTTRGRRDDR